MSTSRNHKDNWFEIHKDNGDHIEVCGQTLTRLLAKPRTMGRLLRELGFDNRLPVELNDGPAIIWRSLRKSEQSSQQRLMLPQPELPTQPYLAQGHLKLILPVRVRCQGQSEAHVKETIRDIVHGRCGIPHDFTFQIRPEDVSALLGKLEISDMTAIVDIDITNCSPYYLLTDGRRI
jgi:hypothetical protein